MCIRAPRKSVHIRQAVRIARDHPFELMIERRAELVWRDYAERGVGHPAVPGWIAAV